MTDKELIDAYRKGNHNAFARFYDNCKDSLYSYIVIRVGTITADDIFQETLEKFVKAVFKYEITSPKSYLYTIAHNQICNLAKRNKTVQFADENYEEMIPDDQILADKALIHKMENEQLSTALAKLAANKPEFYDIVYMHLFDEFGFDEIAKITNQNRNTISARYCYGIKYLKEYYKG